MLAVNYFFDGNYEFQFLVLSNRRSFQKSTGRCGYFLWNTWFLKHLLITNIPVAIERIVLPSKKTAASHIVKELKIRSENPNYWYGLYEWLNSTHYAGTVLFLRRELETENLSGLFQQYFFSPRKHKVTISWLPMASK